MVIEQDHTVKSATQWGDTYMNLTSSPARYNRAMSGSALSMLPCTYDGDSKGIGAGIEAGIISEPVGTK